MANGCNIIPSIGKSGESCCDMHDKAYSKGEFMAKFIGDFTLMLCIIRYRWYMAPIAVLMFILCMTVGWVYWLKYLARRLFGWFPKEK